MNNQRRAKVAIVDELKEKFTTSRAIIFADYKGLNVSRVSMLRRRCRDAGVEMKVSKNTLTRIAVSEIGLEDAIPYLVESTACFYSPEDPVAPAKVIDTFFKEYRLTLNIRGGVVEGKVVGPQAVAALIDLPPKEVLLSQVLGTLVAPISGMLNVMQGNTRNLVYALEALRKQKAGEE
ncbi:MAG: 50S ribosomal protein L10 [Symbiobacteriaceae bacterium]|nr:50S ribosomal protein L10 [Symbiobacteriaceae bacterium]